MRKFPYKNTPNAKVNAMLIAVYNHEVSEREGETKKKYDFFAQLMCALFVHK